MKQAARALSLLLATLVLSSKAQVTSVSPTSGSLCGGTRITISGSGFANETSANRVEIGGELCRVETVSDSELVCTVPYRDAVVVDGNESTTESINVQADGKPLSGSLEFTFEAEKVPGTIVDWGPSAGQASDVLSFEGKEELSGVSVVLDGKECKEKSLNGTYYQCVPPPREAGVSFVEVSFGPTRGNACAGNKTLPLKFTYGLTLQSALPSDWDGDTDGSAYSETQGPLDGGGVGPYAPVHSAADSPIKGQLTGVPCAPRPPQTGTLDIIGQGLGNATVFKLCGGDTWCEREGEVQADSEFVHDGDWSFQRVTCRPGPLDPSKAPGGVRKCDLTAEGADGMFVATLPDVWTYGLASPEAPDATSAPAEVPSPASVPAPAVQVLSASPATAPPLVQEPSTPPPLVLAPAPAVLVPASPVPDVLPLPPPASPAPAQAVGTAATEPPKLAVPTTASPGQALDKMAKKVLSKAFKDLASKMTGGKKEDAAESAVTGIPPAHPQSQALQSPAAAPPPGVIFPSPSLVPAKPLQPAKPADGPALLLLQRPNAGRRVRFQQESHIHQTVQTETPGLRGGFRV